jgi:hypothetical protein
VSLFAAQNQHAPFAEGLGTRLGAEHLAGTGRERDASGGSTPTTQCRHWRIGLSTFKSRRNDSAARGAGFATTLPWCSSGAGEPAPSSFT